jgi:hypothetical protein
LRKRLGRKRCVVCGNPPVGFTGYVYYESGTTRLYAPFCQEHIGKAPQYANPIFESPAAVDLFRQMFPVTYLQDVKDKTVLFFDSNKTTSAN